MNKKISILAIPIAIFTLSNNAKALSFMNALSNYCVPKTAEYCTGPYMATYNEMKNSCECKNSTYLKYSSTDRHCEINCPAGSIAITVSTCPSGFSQIFVAE